MRSILSITLILVMASCHNEKPAETIVAPTQTGVNVEATDNTARKAFVIPDSINTALIIATYVEIDPESHTLLLYTNNDKKKAIQVRYLNDGKVFTDKLDVISENVLRNPISKYEYRINDSSVVFKMDTGHQEEHYRTDANN